MSQNRRNINPIGFLADQRQISKNRRAFYGESWPHVVPLGYVPPFQLVREAGAPNLNSIRLVKVSDGTSQTITVDMFSTGFQILDFTTYKIWSYPGTVPIPTSGVEEGVWTMEIEDTSGAILWREDWCWMQESAMAGFVKMTWFHQREFELPFGHIEFAPPFKFWHWFRTELGKPSYPLERDVDERLSIEYVNSITSWKEQRFVTAGDENFMDALSFVRQMDCVEVEFLGDVINTFRVLIEPNWEGRGDLALIEVEIRSDQITSVFGDALSAKEYEVAPEECVGVGFVAIAEVVESGSGWTNGNYVNSSGATVPFEVGQYVLVRALADGLSRLYVYQSPGTYFGPLALADDAVVLNANSGEYLVQQSPFELSAPVITNVDTTTPGAFVFTGFAIPGTVVALYGRVSSGSPDESLLATFTEAEFNSGVTVNEGLNEGFKVKISTWQCPNIAESEWKTVSSGGGIGESEVGVDFEIG